MEDRQAQTDPVRVLVVDDEVDLANTLVTLLRRRGFAAAAVFSGAEAVTVAERGDADVLVLDLKMPGQDGLATLRQVRQRAPGVRVIMLTGHGTVATGVEGMSAGAVDFLQKPADIDALCVAIVAAART